MYDFKTENLSKFIYLKREGNTDDLFYFKKAIIKSPVYDPYFTVLNPENKPFESRNGNMLAWAIGTFVFGALIIFFIINQKKVELLLGINPSTSHKRKQ